MALDNIDSFENFEKFFFKRIRGLDKNKENVKKRINKFYELVTLKDKASDLSFEDNSALRRISIVLTTNCNLKCVWCHREEKHVIESGYLSKNNKKK